MAISKKRGKKDRSKAKKSHKKAKRAAKIKKVHRSKSNKKDIKKKKAVKKKSRKKSAAKIKKPAENKPEAEKTETIKSRIIEKISGIGKQETGGKRELARKINSYQDCLKITRKEMAKMVVGQQPVIDSLFRALIADGNVLLEGVPGIAKTLIVKTLAGVTGCRFSRIQFTADLLPTDITGITAYDPKKGFYVVKGPIFADFVLADEINRAPPKVQSAMLECMQERQVSIGHETFKLDRPFFVLATQNPLEQLGTYPLPEAQVDRFLFKLFINYPGVEEEQEILDKNMTTRRFEHFKLNQVLTKQKLLEIQQTVHDIFIDSKIEAYIVRIVDATRFPDKYNIKLGKFIEWGGSPRASIGLYIASKAEALLNNRIYVTPTDVKSISHDVLRHRVLLNYEGQSQGIKSDDVITEILSKIPVP